MFLFSATFTVDDDAIDSRSGGVEVEEEECWCGGGGVEARDHGSAFVNVAEEESGRGRAAEEDE